MSDPIVSHREIEINRQFFRTSSILIQNMLRHITFGKGLFVQFPHNALFYQFFGTILVKLVDHHNSLLQGLGDAARRAAVREELTRQGGFQYFHRFLIMN